MSLFYKHFMSPKNVGVLKSADCTREYNDSAHNMKVLFYGKIRSDRKIQVKYKVVGCSIAIVMSSYLSELCKEKGVDELEALEFDKVYSLFSGDVPEEQRECAEVVFNTFQELVHNCKNLKKEA